MRLLQRDDKGNYSLTPNLGSEDLPSYAILSHTWGTDEIFFADLKKTCDDWQQKSGYRKLEFCADQAIKDGIQFFWVDTCCIDKSDSIEFQTAINSMFRWYRDADRCYVFLEDISILPKKSTEVPWEGKFRESRWFTRGWTLQELIAPRLVDFYSREGIQLGDKVSLEPMIHEITGIPISALRGAELSEFPVLEREAWIKGRQTTYEEDMVYSLLGIFGVFMFLNYGEGKSNAQNRLHEEIQKVIKGGGTQASDFSIIFSLSGVPEILKFVAREKEITEIHKSLGSDGSRQVVVLHGLGGIGKTQLAVTYLKRYRDQYSAIFWFNIKDEASIHNSYIKVAKQILKQYPNAIPVIDTLGGLQTANKSDIIEAVNSWLSLPNNTRWLIIYDNYDTPRLPGQEEEDNIGIDIEPLLPCAYQGSIIITTRLSQINIGHQIEINRLKSADESLEILSSTSGRDNLHKDIDAQKLVEKLDGLPLALATAGSYLRYAPISCADYLRLYETSWARLHKSTPNLGSYKDRTLCSTWQVSYNQIQAQNPLAAHLLQWWAYFDNQDIWFELLRASGQQLGDKDAPPIPIWIYNLADELNFHSAMRTLCDYGFVELHPVPVNNTDLVAESRGYSIHGCLHSWTIHVLNEKWNDSLASFTLKLVASRVPSSESDDRFWLVQKRILSHAIAVSTKVRGDNDDDNDNSNLNFAFHKLGRLYADQGKLNEAEKMYSRALRGYERICGPNHPSTLDIVHNQGAFYRSQGKLKEAEEVYTRALQGYKLAFGPHHSSTLKTVNNLGNLYVNQGKLKEAEEMYLLALQDKETTVSGLDYVLTLGIVNNLGHLYTAQGNFKDAEDMYQSALAGYNKTLGAQHISTLDTVNNLGNLYTNQGKLKEAEDMYIQALKGQEKTWGPDHISTLKTVNNLGLLYMNQGNLNKAEDMYLRAYKGKEKNWGPDHISTINTVANLGLLYASQGKLKEAEDMLRRALEGYKKNLGPTHESTLKIVGRLGHLYKDQGRLKEAEEMYLSALRADKVIKPDDKITLDLLNNLEKLYIA